MKLFITGSNGMVGRNLVSRLSHEKNVILLTPSHEELNLIHYEPLYCYMKTHAPDFVIHCAGIVGGIQANMANPLKFLLDNIEMGKNLLIAAKNLKIKNIINLGSSCMYPNNFTDPIKETMILKGPLEPTNEGYALSKVVIAKLAEYISKENAYYNYKTLIPCNLYGEYDKFDENVSHLIPAIIKKIYEAKKNHLNTVEIWGDGSARREFMYIKDLVDFIMFAIDNFHKIPLFINVGLAEDYSVEDYYRTAAKIIGYEGNFVYNTNRPIGMQRKKVDISLQKLLGWMPKHSLFEGIEKTFNFYRQHTEKYL